MSKQPAPEDPVPVLVSHGEPLTDVGTRPDNARSGSPPPIASIDKHEPIVTRRELWSYYCK